MRETALSRWVEWITLCPMKLRFDLVEKITPEMLMESVLANHHRYKAEPLLSKTGTGSLSPASTEDRCDRGKALHGHNSETYERVRNRWEEHSPRELTLGDTLDFLLDCHRSAPFLFFKGKKDCIMIPFHSLLPEIAQREVRCIHLGAAPGESPDSGLSAGEYAFVEFYCEDLDCDCRRVFIEVIARHQQDQVLASINYGWDEESFYRKRMSWDP